MVCCEVHFFSHSSDVLIDDERIHDRASHSAHTDDIRTRTREIEKAKKKISIYPAP